MSENFAAATASKIEAARSTEKLGARDYLVSHRNIESLLAEREAKSPDKIFLTYLDDDMSLRREWTYNTFGAEVRKLTHAMHAELGLRRGDRVATLAHNHDETALQYFAAWLLGCVAVPINMGEDDERIRFILDNAEVKAAFVRPEYAERAGGILASLPRVEHRIAVGFGEKAAPKGWKRLEKILEGKSASFSPPEKAALEDEALIVYTSGTTGAPKGVLLVQYNLFADAKGIAEWHRFTPGDRLMCVLPIHHVNGTIVTLITPLYFGGSVVLTRKFKAGGFWKRIADEKVTCVSVVPTLLEFLYERNEDNRTVDINRFRHFICGAGPLTVDLALRFENRFNVPIIHGYGLSETTCYSCFLPLDLSDEERRHWLSYHGFPSIGAAIDVNDMDIHDAEGKPVGDGKRGEIVIRGHNVMKAYFKRPDANAETFNYNWFRSGDEGFALTRRPSKGEARRFYFITGRLKELIIRGGVNLSPFEIDEVLRAIPGVKSAVCVAFDHKYYGEEVGAYVQLEPGAKLTEQDIMTACRNVLSYAKTPKAVVFGEDIPVTSTGKYQRNKLKPLFEKWKDVQFRE